MRRARTPDGMGRIVNLSSWMKESVSACCQPPAVQSLDWNGISNDEHRWSRYMVPEDQTA
jgi:hypothetical protein